MASFSCESCKVGESLLIDLGQFVEEESLIDSFSVRICVRGIPTWETQPPGGENGKCSRLSYCRKFEKGEHRDAMSFISMNGEGHRSIR